MLTLQFSGNATTGQVKEITHAGKRYLVSPVVALREGILNDIFVSASEFSKFAAAWAGRPVPISHPKSDGGYTSANTPDIWATDVLGHLWNVEVNNGALKGEIWIDLDKAQLMGTRATAIVNRLRAGQPLEVSTGYFCEMEVTPGTWAGKSYSAIAHNIRPDHLALLPDEAGACSWADGCGTPRVNSQGESMDEQSLFNRFLGWLKNDQSQNISPISNAEGTVSALPCSCEPAEGQIAIESILPIEETPSMNKSELIGALAANAKCKFSQEKLATWEEADLQVLQESLDAGEPSGPAPAAEAAAAAEVPSATVAAALPAEITQFAEMIRGLGGMDKLAQALGNLSANSDQERTQLVAAIVANCRGAFTEGELARYDTNKLRTIYGSYLPRDYSANAGALRPAFGPEEEELVMHWPIFENASAQNGGANFPSDSSHGGWNRSNQNRGG